MVDEQFTLREMEWRERERESQISNWEMVKFLGTTDFLETVVPLELKLACRQEVRHLKGQKRKRKQQNQEKIKIRSPGTHMTEENGKNGPRSLE